MPNLLTQIAEDAVDESIPLAALLRKCIMLGAQGGSKQLSEWATKELEGYVGRPPLPDYRLIHAVMELRITNRMGVNAITQQLSPSDLPKDILEVLGEDRDIETATMAQSIGELEAFAASNTNPHRFSPGWAPALVSYLNEHAVMDEISVITNAYWVVHTSSIQGLLSRVRTKLVQLVAELVVQTPQDQAVPDKATMDRAVQVLIYGEHNTVNLQQAGDNSTVSANTAAAPAATAIGSQSADGDNATIVGSQNVQGAQGPVAGRDNAAIEHPATGSWWTQTRKRGVLITVATVVAAAVAVFAWLGWTPWG